MSDSDLLVIIELDRGIATIRLNRPEQGNALSLDLVRRLHSVCRDVASDRSVRCVLLTGTGRFFCVGGDIGGFSAAGDGVPALLKKITDELNAAISLLAHMEKPVVVAVNGPAAGAGLGLAAIGDIVFAAGSAHFSMAHTAIGLTPDGGTTWLLPRLIGLRRAQDMALTNRRVPSKEAAEIGLITRVFPDELLLAEATLVAAQLAQGATHAFARVRSLFTASADLSINDLMALEAKGICAAASGREGREGIAAFLAKRKPDFQPTADSAGTATAGNI